jgi:Glycosyl hydrolases family 16
MRRIVVGMVAAVAAISVVTTPASGTASATAGTTTITGFVPGAVRPGACGGKVKKPNGSTWVCHYVDAFSGKALNPLVWTVQKSSNSAAMPDQACWENDPDNVRVFRGKLLLTVRKENAPFTCDSPWGDFQTQYTGGSVSTWDKMELTTGRVEIRAKFPAATVTGIHSALWMYPREMTYGPWPRSGEIDIGEYYTRYPDRAIPYLHYDTDSPDPVTNTQCFIRNPRTFHTYTLEWTPGLITIDYDRKRCLTHHIDAKAPLTGSAPFDKPFFLILTQTLGIGQNPFNASTTPLPQTMEIDRVRIWQ